MGDELPKRNVCACKGIRTCLLCETSKPRVVRNNVAVSSVAYSDSGFCHIRDTVGVTVLLPGQGPYSQKSERSLVYRYCHHCCKAWKSSDHTNHPRHEGESIPLEGIVICEDFITSDEEDKLVSEIYTTPFVDSQSGRRKQDYGPKVNFKKRKVKTEVFSGLPPFSQLIYDRMKPIKALAGFVPVELCNLEYDVTRGASIDPHFDDFWLWGERLVTLNLLSDSVLCFTRDDNPDIEIHVVMPRRSLIVVAGEARNKWKHGIHRSDINGKRIAVTFRELSDEFKVGGTQEQCGKQLIDLALSFQGQAIGS